MKKLSLLLAVALVLSLAACTTEVEVPVETITEYVEAPPVEIPAEVTMANIDTLLDRDNVQFVDLRNYTDKMASGYIAGFEIISFFEYLEGNAIQRTNGWTWETANLLDADVLANFFDADADAIFLMCGSGTRAGFVKSALEQAGFTNVYNAGGIRDYIGENMVAGDSVYGSLPAVVTMANIDEVLDADGVQFIDLRNWNDKMASGYISGFEMIPFFQYLEVQEALVRTNGWTWETANLLDADILENFFDKDAKAIYLMCGSGTRAGFVMSALEQLGYTNVVNVGGIKDYTGDNMVDGDSTYVLPTA